jgi:SAM-dependent methyltransferase
MSYERMEETVYEQFRRLEEHHFWFIGRRRIFLRLLDRVVVRGRRDLEILEIGCGAGGFLGPLARHGRVTGMDIAHDWMRFCAERGYRRLLTASGYALPYRDENLDLICLFDTLEHIPDDQQVLHECRRVLRPGGHLFISVPAYQWLYSRNDKLSHHQRRYTRRGLTAKLLRARLTPVKATYFNAFLFPLILPVLLIKKAKERLLVPPEDQTTNLTHEFIAPVNLAFTTIFAGERLLLDKIDFPFGHSLVGIARRPA